MSIETGGAETFTGNEFLQKFLQGFCINFKGVILKFSSSFTATFGCYLGNPIIHITIVASLKLWHTSGKSSSFFTQQRNLQYIKLVAIMQTYYSLMLRATLLPYTNVYSSTIRTKNYTAASCYDLFSMALLTGC